MIKPIAKNKIEIRQIEAARNRRWLILNSMLKLYQLYGGENFEINQRYKFYIDYEEERYPRIHLPKGIKNE